MAKKQALKGLFVDVLEEADKLKTSLSGVKKELADISKIEKDKLNIIDTNTVKGVKELEELLKRLNEVKESHVKISKIEQKLKQEENKVTQQLKASTDEEVKAKLRYNSVVSEQRKRLKGLIDLERAEIGSINELRAKNKLLTAERNALGRATTENKEKIDELNAEIDKNNELIRESSDLLTKQKMNVGNYRKDIEDAIGSLSQNNQVLGILANGYANLSSVLNNAKGIFEGLKNELAIMKETIIQNTLATQKNTVATEVATEVTEANTVATSINTAWLSKHYQALILNTKAIYRMIFSLRGLKIALVGTGIGVIILALVGLVGMFSQGISGTLRFQRVMKMLEATLKNVFSGLVSLSKGFFGIFKDLIDLFVKGLTGDIKGAVNELYELKESLNDLENGIKQLGKTGEVAMKGFDGAVTALRRNFEIMKKDIAIADLQKQYQALSEFAEDDTVNFSTRNKAYAQSSALRTKIITENLRRETLETQKNLATIVSKYETTSEVIDETQKGFAEKIKSLYKVDTKNMGVDELKSYQIQVQKVMNEIINYADVNAERLASLGDDKLDMPFIDVEDIEAMKDNIVSYSALLTELNDEIIRRGEQERKYIQDHYESLLDIQENYILRYGDNLSNIADNERNSFDVRKKALSSYVFASKNLLEDAVADFNKYTQDLAKSLDKTSGDLDITNKMKAMKLSIQQVGNEFKLFANGVELNQDVFQADLLKGLTGENAEKTVTFFRTMNDLFTDVNTKTLALTNQNMELAKSYRELTYEKTEIETQYNNELILAKNKNEADLKSIQINEELTKGIDLRFMNDVEYEKFKVKQRDSELKANRLQTDNEINGRAMKAKADKDLATQRLENAKTYAEEVKAIEIKENEILVSNLEKRLKAETDAVKKAELEKQLEIAKTFNAYDTEAYIKAQNEVTKAELDVLKATNDQVAIETEKKEENQKRRLEDQEIAREKEMKELKKRADLLRDVADGIDQIEQAYHERKMRRLDREYERSKQHEQRLLEAKKIGSDQANESLAMEIAKQEKILAKKEKLEQRKRRLEFVTAGIKAYASNLEKGITNPLSKTFTDVTLLAQTLKSLPLFWEGTEHVGKSLGKQHLNDKRDNYIVRVDKDERIMTKDQNNKVGSLSNDELADVGMKWNAGLLADVTKLNFKPSDTKLIPYQVQKVDNSEYYLKEIKQELRELPNRMPLQSFEYDQVNKMAVDVIKLGNTTTRTRTRIRK